MDCTLHLQKLQRYAAKHDELPSASALPLVFDCTAEAAEEVVRQLTSQGHLLTGSGGLRPGPAFGQELAPLSGQAIPAGMPAALADDLHDRLNMHAYLVPSPSNTVIVPICGDSMSGAGIVDGDLGVIDLSAQPQIGDIVAAEIDGQFTLKRLAAGANGAYILRAENPAYPELSPSDSLRIHGVLVGLARRY